MTPVLPTLAVEADLLDRYDLVIALDEVGRGALAGPTAVGVAVLDASRIRRGEIPEGLRDSKLVPEKRRPDVAARAASWVQSSAVGWASAQEVDGLGIIHALGLAASRGIDAVVAEGVPLERALILLDGNHDYVSPVHAVPLAVQPLVKADRDCASVSAASVIAKVARDALLVRWHDDYPVYGWDRNKGYASAVHRDALREHGLSPHHRASWVTSFTS